MRALVQRVSRAAVYVSTKEIASIGNGLVVFLAIGKSDSMLDVDYLVNKITNLRIFSNNDGKFDQSALDRRAELLVVSQFTLYADTRKGRRPSFTGAAEPVVANELFQKAIDLFKSFDLNISTGIFQEKMSVEIVNEGPVTVWIDSKDKDISRNSA